VVVTHRSQTSQTDVCATRGLNHLQYVTTSIPLGGSAPPAGFPDGS
jgi:hypothetical protein